MGESTEYYVFEFSYDDQHRGFISENKFSRRFKRIKYLFCCCCFNN